jgi:carboxymethylenebutenolidase
MPDIEFAANGSTASGYLAVPGEGSGPGLVVMQEWWGVDDHIRSVCDRFAAEGFVVLAPDLYRGEVATRPDEAQQRMMALEMDEAEVEMRGAVSHLRDSERTTGSAIGAVGFCLGGGLAVWAAAANPEIGATVTFYYVMPHGTPDFSKVRGPVLGHFGTADKVIPTEAARALESRMRSAGCDVAFEYYEGAGHAFFNDTDRLGTFDEPSSRVAWERTVQFLKAQLA